MNYAGQASTAAYGHSNSEPAATPTNPLPGALNGLGYAIGQLESHVMQLRDRLERVLTPIPPAPTGSDKAQLGTAPPPSSDMTQEVSHQSRRVDLLAMNVGELLARLEV